MTRIPAPRARDLDAFVLRLAGRVMGFDPFARLRIRQYAPTLRNWPEDLSLRIVALADLHACDPYMNAERIAHICANANALEPDIILLLGDYMTAIHSFARGEVPLADWTGELAKLNAPLGVHAVLGNHDWWEDAETQTRGAGPCSIGAALERVGIAFYENSATRLEKDGRGFWLAGLGDQRAFRFHEDGQRRFEGVDDLEATLSRVTDDAPVLLMAHEPDIFPKVPERVALTLSGHTHGGQVKLFGQTPIVPSEYGSRYVYGHIREDGRDLIVSSGLGCSGIPIRFGVPPEIIVVELGGMGRLPYAV